jgi:HSP20 family protein
MSLFKNQSLITKKQNPINLWQKEMNNLFSKVNRELGTFDFDSDEYLPKVEIKDNAKSILVSAEVPGMTEKDINVTLRDNVLILEGERKSEASEEKDDYSFSEFSYGSFYRSIPLDEEVNPDSVKASYKDGILKVDLQKVNESSHKSKKIQILKS